MSVPLARNVKFHRFLARVLPIAGIVTFYAALIAIPSLPQLKKNLDVSENSYLHGFITDNVTYDGINFMIDTISTLKQSCELPTEKEITHSYGLEGYSYWYDNVQEDGPELYKAIEALVKEKAPRLEVNYNDFRYVFKTGLGVTGTSMLFRLKCARCKARGATLVVATVDTGSKRSHILDESGNVMKAPENGSTVSACSTSVTGASIALAAMREMTRYDNQVQDVILFITDRNLPYAAGTRQFLDDYFSKPDFKWRSGWLHNAAALDLGYGRCGRYKINYEGIDGLIPNQDVVSTFLMEAENQMMDISTMGLWERVGSMSFNAYPHLPHVPMLSRNIAAFSITCAKKASKGEETPLDRLMKTLLVTMRMQNNLENVLERGNQAYEVVSQEHYVPQVSYTLLVPALLLAPTAQLLYSGYTWDLHAIIAALSLFLVNAFMGSWLSYRYLVGAVGSDFPSSSEGNLSRVKIALALLLLSNAVLLALNLFLFRLVPARYFSNLEEDKKVILRQELLADLGYPPEIEPISLCVARRLNVLMERFRRRSDTLLRFFQRPEDAGPRERRLKRLSLKITSLMQRMGMRNGQSIYTQNLQEEPVAVTPEPIVEHDTQAYGSETGEEENIRVEKEELLESMGKTEVIYPTNTGMPLPHILVSIGTLFFALVFLYAMLIFNWPLCIILTLALIPSLRSVRIWGHTRCKLWVDTLVCTAYLLTILIISRRPSLINSVKDDFMYQLFGTDSFDPRILVAGPLYNLYVFVTNCDKDEILAALRGPFVLQKLYNIAQQHALFGSSAFPLIWFCAFPVVFHTVLIYTLARFYKPSVKSD